MHSVYALTFTGLALAALIQTGFFLTARLLGRERWPFAYLLLLLATASLLALQALLPLPWLPAVVLAGLLATSLRQISRESLVFLWRRPPLPVLIAGAALLLDVIYAAFPAFRFDQWTYHLVLPKLIAELGPLKLPIYEEHVFFAGAYEYLFTLPRVVTSNDVINQCFSNSFSILAFLLPTAGLLYLGRLPAVSTTLLVAYALFALPEHDAITNTKPDVILLPIGLACLFAAARWREAAAAKKAADAAPWAFFLAALLVGSVAFKVTWLHFALALSGGFALSLLLFPAGPLGSSAIPALVGAVLGAVIYAPIAYKNWHFFGNPLHPAQFAVFKSLRWHAGMTQYWQSCMHKALNARDFLRILAENVWRLPQRTVWLWSPLVPLLVYEFAPKKGARSPRFFLRELLREQPVLWLALLLALTLWPFFYSADVAPRFVFPLYSLILAASLVVLSRCQSAAKPAVAWLLVAVAVSSSSTEVHIARMADGLFKSVDEYYSPDSRPPLNERPLSLAVNVHRAEHFPGANYNEYITLADTPAGYFLNSSRLHIDSNDYVWHYLQLLKEKPEACLWDFLKRHNITYFIAITRPLDEWPAAFNVVRPWLKPISGNLPVFFLDPAVTAEEAARC